MSHSFLSPLLSFQNHITKYYELPVSDTLGLSHSIIKIVWFFFKLPLCVGCLYQSDKEIELTQMVLWLQDQNMENYNVVEREEKKKPNSSFTSVPIKPWETHRDTIMLDRAEQMLQWIATVGSRENKPVWGWSFSTKLLICSQWGSLVIWHVSCYTRVALSCCQLLFLSSELIITWSPQTSIGICLSSVSWARCPSEDRYGQNCMDIREDKRGL